jgi:hypothetical protein
MVEICCNKISSGDWPVCVQMKGKAHGPASDFLNGHNKMPAAINKMPIMAATRPDSLITWNPICGSRPGK